MTGIFNHLPKYRRRNPKFGWELLRQMLRQIEKGKVSIVVLRNTVGSVPFYKLFVSDSVGKLAVVRSTVDELTDS